MNGMKYSRSHHSESSRSLYVSKKGNYVSSRQPGNRSLKDKILTLSGQNYGFSVSFQKPLNGHGNIYCVITKLTRNS